MTREATTYGHAQRFGPGWDEHAIGLKRREHRYLQLH